MLRQLDRLVRPAVHTEVYDAVNVATDKGHLSLLPPQDFDNLDQLTRDSHMDSFFATKNKLQIKCVVLFRIMKFCEY